MIAALLGRTLTHLHRKELYEGDHEDSDRVFWKRHRFLDDVINNTLRHLPPRLQIGSSLLDPGAVLLHVSIQASTICLHQAAVFKAKATSGKDFELVESKTRRIEAAETMMRILRVVDPATIAKVTLQNMSALLEPRANKVSRWVHGYRFVCTLPHVSSCKHYPKQTSWTGKRNWIR
jgi:hypothetical protein